MCFLLLIQKKAIFTIWIKYCTVYPFNMSLKNFLRRKIYAKNIQTCFGGSFGVGFDAVGIHNIGFGSS